MSRFFIDRPIFAWVIAHRADARPACSRSARCRSRSIPTHRAAADRDHRRSIRAPTPQTLENTVTQVIEQQMTGLDGLRLLLVDERLDRHGDDHR